MLGDVQRAFSDLALACGNTPKHPRLVTGVMRERALVQPAQRRAGALRLHPL
jgi:hypothetical protein